MWILVIDGPASTVLFAHPSYSLLGDVPWSMNIQPVSCTVQLRGILTYLYIPYLGVQYRAQHTLASVPLELYIAC